jgi:hypothetical protein
VAAAVSAVDARRVTRRALDDEDVARSLTRPVRLVAAGKAATGMAAAVAARLGGLVVDGVVTVLDAAATSEEVRGLSAEVIATTHPIPGPGSERAGRRALALAHDSATSGGTLLVCLSGGASAMLVVPAAGLTVQDKADATAVLLRSGLPIQEMNLIRRQWSAIKGGRLAAAAGRSVTLAISDVPVDPADEPAAIASGPTVGQPPGRAAALAVVRREGLAPLLPPAALAALESVVDDEGAGQRDAVDARFRVVASRHDAMEAAASTARALGYATRVIAPPVWGPRAMHGARWCRRRRTSIGRSASSPRERRRCGSRALDVADAIRSWPSPRSRRSPGTRPPRWRASAPTGWTAPPTRRVPSSTQPCGAGWGRAPDRFAMTSWTAMTVIRSSPNSAGSCGRDRRARTSEM